MSSSFSWIFGPGYHQSQFLAASKRFHYLAKLTFADHETGNFTLHLHLQPGFNIFAELSGCSPTRLIVESNLFHASNLTYDSVATISAESVIMLPYTSVWFADRKQICTPVTARPGHLHLQPPKFFRIGKGDARNISWCGLARLLARHNLHLQSN